MDVSIIIVNYNTCNIIRNCLKSIFDKTEGIDYEVIVSDNGSTDGSIEMIKKEFPQVILIENNANLGFGAANNRGLKIAKGKYIFYLNSDTILLNNAVKCFFEYWEGAPNKDSIGALGGVLQDEKGNIIHSGGYFPRRFREIIGLFGKIIIFFICWALRIKYCRQNISEYIAKPEYITGADLFIKNNIFAYFDERFFMYYEEVFLQKQIKKHGFNIFLINSPKIIHLDGMSSKKGTGDLNDYTSLKKIYAELSKIKYQKYSKNFLTALIMQVLLYIFWSLPCFKGKNNKYKQDIWKI